MNDTEIEVLNPGALSTVQDLGRFGYAHLGISPAGAADSLSFRIGNRIVGNDENAPAIEMTLVGSTLRFGGACTIALAGAEVTGIPMYERVRMEPGSRLESEPLRNGARSYLAVTGGIAVPSVLGSASTHLAAGFGGFLGRALKRGDILKVPVGIPASRAANPLKLRQLSQPRKEIRFVKNEIQGLFSPESFNRFGSSEYVVLEQSNRLGIRLSGPAVPSSSSANLLTQGVSLGTIQSPPDGQPIILCVDQQTTGGYPVLGNVITADMHCVGQLRPRDTVTFSCVSLEKAIHALRDQERSFAEAFGG